MLQRMNIHGGLARSHLHTIIGALGATVQILQAARQRYAHAVVPKAMPYRPATTFGAGISCDEMRVPPVLKSDVVAL